ncbi:aspergillopepsin-2 precursor, putative [Talaromyces stipitatus ATCC 10500]|uniref:Aspergillopepsin-2, putative n=1 Tax=Talaromyces stipitatus (strain ATCC 10500 / CBS 375.48 / QM 6759 / NRRL 1006) TaxID=441959 RepID=B8M5B3_TALSN|nr:aspergillopepsin-2 precursor, putative [Talaromyces stipitatus ATCC 10500]EED19719.1 aspergillopepsin-2 precursor, putative [Talaromyces stipitatus ATCC 10500]
MIISIITILPLLLSGITIARPATIPAARRFRSGGPSSTYKNFTASDASASTKGTYTFTNWAGAFLDTTDVTGITGTFTVPTPSAPAGSDPDTSYCGCAWVGLDGISNFCPKGGLMQAGVNWCVENGVSSFVAWYEWWPAEAQQYWDDIDVSAGDSITVTIAATSKTGGTANLVNNSSGQRATFTWTDESPALCEVSAEWIVEDYSVGNELVAFADYGSVTFTGNSALVGGATADDLTSAYLADMVSQSDSSDVISASSLKVISRRGRFDATWIGDRWIENWADRAM